MDNAAAPLLEARNIEKRFGGLTALSGVSLSIHRGEIYGLIGPNGAGKTTLFNVITGVYVPDGGSFLFDGAKLNGLKPHRVVQQGIARTFQNIRLFANMSALENVMVGRHLRSRAGVLGAILRGPHTRAEEAAIRRRAFELLDYVGIRRHAHALSKNLAYGDQRRLEIARALATEPKLLALDEPAAGMNATETVALRGLLEKIRADGITLLLIEHDVKLVMGLCNRVAVLDYGKKIAEGEPAQVQRDPAVIQAYLGGALPVILLELRELKIAYGGINAVKGIDLVVHEGEMVALIGANGAGKTSTLKAISGILSPASGHIEYRGSEVIGCPAYTLVERGLALVPEGRQVFGRLTVLENLRMGAYARRDGAQVRTDLQRIYELFPRLYERRTQTAGTLSGGEQQMLAIGRALMSAPKLLLLDEPSMGLAPLMVQRIFETIGKVAAEGVTVLLVEQNAKLALELSKRGYVMESGTITLSGDSATLLNDPQVRQAYLGE